MTFSLLVCCNIPVIVFIVYLCTQLINTILLCLDEEITLNDLVIMTECTLAAVVPKAGPRSRLLKCIDEVISTVHC